MEDGSPSVARKDPLFPVLVLANVEPWEEFTRGNIEGAWRDLCDKRMPKDSVPPQAYHNPRYVAESKLQDDADIDAIGRA